jgi:hypothetical protein
MQRDAAIRTSATTPVPDERYMRYCTVRKSFMTKIREGGGGKGHADPPIYLGGALRCR